MAVSSKGSVCYWSNALHDPPTSLEGSVDMGEGQGYMLVTLPSGRGGCLLTTTLCDLFLITPPVSQVGSRDAYTSMMHTDRAPVQDS